MQGCQRFTIMHRMQPFGGEKESKREDLVFPSVAMGVLVLPGVMRILGDEVPPLFSEHCHHSKRKMTIVATIYSLTYTYFILTHPPKLHSFPLSFSLSLSPFLSLPLVFTASTPSQPDQ